MIKLDLPIWGDKGELVKLKNVAYRWFLLVQSWLLAPLKKHDAESCSIESLELLAWERGITQLAGEDIRLYRLRVKYAYINAVDAGSKNGLIRIFKRLGLGDIEITERSEHTDWDLISIDLESSQISGNETLLRELVKMYGRTCRRYYLSTRTPNVSLILKSNSFSHSVSYSVAEATIVPTAPEN